MRLKRDKSNTSSMSLAHGCHHSNRRFVCLFVCSFVCLFDCLLCSPRVVDILRGVALGVVHLVLFGQDLLVVRTAETGIR